MPDVTHRPATTADRSYIVDLLAANDLPTGDVPDLIGDFSVFEVDGEPIGTAALVRYENDALLRSVVIEADVRGQGYGRTCCQHLIGTAASERVDAIYLLTTTAAEFFGDLGFDTVDREEVPDPIRETRLFTELCPRSATVMCYRVESNAET